MIRLPMSLAALLVACPPTGDTGDSDTSLDSGPTRSGLLGREGAGQFETASYTGTEERFFVAEEGQGADVCRIHYDLTSVGPQRTDCEDCLFAFDLQVGNAGVTVDEDPICLSLWEVSDISELDGTQVGYGYVAEYLGHASVLMLDRGTGVWEPAAYATLDEETGALTYTWNEGYIAY